MRDMRKTFLLSLFLIVGCGSEGAELPAQEASAVPSASTVPSSLPAPDASAEVTLSHDCSCLDFQDGTFVDACVSPVLECTDEEVLLCVAE